MTQFESFGPKDTFEIGRALSKEAAPGMILSLIGDLGAGKTEFTKGYAAGLGIGDPVTSPTFTILQVYENGRIPLYHFDLYRLEDEDELFETGADEYFGGDGVCLVEWADKIPGAVPEEAVSVRIDRVSGKGPDYRLITVDRDQLT